MDGKSIRVPESKRVEHVVTRDSKGRVYVRYEETGNAYQLVRYTSEGDGPAAITIPPAITNISSVMNDFTTGNSYVIGSYDAVYKVEGDAVNATQLTALDHLSGPAAIDNGRVVWGNRVPIYTVELRLVVGLLTKTILEIILKLMAAKLQQ